ncbi:hypothetical protein PENTCL1PPCAC_9657, partial [Pristionchus entomophagus]
HLVETGALVHLLSGCTNGCSCCSLRTRLGQQHFHMLEAGVHLLSDSCSCSIRSRLGQQHVHLAWNGAED